LSKRSVRVVKAFSSPLRLNVLKLLLAKGQLSYTEIMDELKLNPGRDAGRFAYHLKLLVGARLIELDSTTKRYRLTELGRMIVDMTEEIESKVSSRRPMLVRTSRASLEEFDRGKIVNSLVLEAGVPLREAQRVAREAERRLQKFRTKYLTAPLIREIVNTVLVERGLEEYRHKLTRLGLPVYDVTNLMKGASESGSNVNDIIHSAGEAIFSEYTLLNVFPRDVSDAHLSGILHIEKLGSWILKPQEFFHDLRFLFRHGVRCGKAEHLEVSLHPPKSFPAVLEFLIDALDLASQDVSEGQILQHFNVFLAPFIRGLSEDEVKRELSRFIMRLKQKFREQDITLGLELSMPEFLERKAAYANGGVKVGTYSDYVEESLKIASMVTDILLDSKDGRPTLNPVPVFYIREWNIEPEDPEWDVLYKAHQLAAEVGTPIFSNQCRKIWEKSAASTSGSKLNSEWTGDWEVDTLRTGVLGRVVLNMPRVYYDSMKSRRRFDRLLDERVEMAARALEIKYLAIRQRGEEGLLHFLDQSKARESYFRLENSEMLISVIGLNETLALLLGREPNYSDGDVKTLEKLLDMIIESVERYSSKYKRRIRLSMTSESEAAERLASLDVERYGWAKVKAEGDRDNPIYTDLGAVPLTRNISLRRRLKVESVVHSKAVGGHLAVIQLEEQNPESMLSHTLSTVRELSLGLFTYSTDFTYCSECGKIIKGTPPKCPLCGSVGAVTGYSRLTTKYTPLSHWSPQRLSLKGRYKRYVISDD